MSKYYLELDASGFEAPCDEGLWLGYGTIVCEGDSLEECLDTASVDLCDQDGGEFRQDECGSEFEEYITEEFLKKYPNGVRTRADAEAEAERPSDSQVNLKTYGPGEL